MTFRQAMDVWHTIDGAVFMGFALYFYLTRRNAERRLQRVVRIAQSQEALIKALTAWARTKGYIFQFGDSPQNGDEPERLH